jgi:hypothetical protein
MGAAKVNNSSSNRHEERGPLHIAATYATADERPHSNMQTLDLVDTTQYIAAVCPIKQQPPAAALLAPNTASSSSVLLPRTGSTGWLPLSLLMNMQRLEGITE